MSIFLHNSRKTWYHRTTVPEKLQGLLNGREQIWRSLKTADKDEARLRSAYWETRVQGLFRALRRDGVRMTNEEREVLVAHWLESELEEAEDYRATFGPISE